MDEEKRITLRLPGDVHAAIAELADQDVRSLNAEILVLLREAIGARRAGQESRSTVEDGRPFQAAAGGSRTTFNPR